MKAQVLHKFNPVTENPLVLDEMPTPEPGQNEILVRVSCCGVCHTDLHAVEGELNGLSLPRVPGHQVVGRVEKTGKLVSKFKPGERAGVAWLYSACGICKFCQSGRENLCRSAEFTGYQVNGGYAEFILVKEDFAYVLPEKFDDLEAAPLLCAGIIGYRAFKFSQIQPGGKIGLIGFGASAHLVIQIARHWKCRVFVFSRSDEHRQLALNLGAEWTGNIDQSPEEKLDAAIVFAPRGELYISALRLVERGGTVVSAGIHMTPIPEFDYSLLYHERKLVSVANATREDGREFLELAAKIPVRANVQVFSLEEANKVLSLMKAGRLNGAAVLRI